MYNECRKERMQFQDRLGACSRALGSWLLPNGDIPQSIAKLVEQVNASRAYHANDGVGEDSPASTSSVKYFRGQIAERNAKIQRLESDVERLCGDKKVANGLTAHLEGLLDADREKINRLEVELAAVKIERDIFRQAGDNALAKIDQLRVQRDCLLAKVEKYENGHHPHDDCGARIAELRYEVDVALKERDQWRQMTTEARRERDATAKQRDDAQAKLHQIYLITIDAEDNK